MSFSFRNVAFTGAVSVGGASLNPVATDWAARVETNGGAAPSSETVQALSDFVDALDAASLTSKMIAVSCMVPDSLTAAITPLIAGPGLDPWTNNNFTAPNLDVDGLQGSAAGPRYLDSGVQPATHFNSSADCGCTVYNMAAINESTRDAGSLVASYSAAFALHLTLSGTTLWDCWSTGDRIQVANSAFTGYVSANRFSTNTQSVYRANSSVPHEVLGTRNGLASAFTGNVYGFYFFSNNSSGSPAFTGNKKFSFCAVHDGLTESESADLYTAVQAMRTALGGGYV